MDGRLSGLVSVSTWPIPVDIMYPMINGLLSETGISADRISTGIISITPTT